MYKSLDNLSKFFYLGTLIPLVAALFTPLLINSRFLFPFITPKTLFFRLAIEVSIFFYLLLILKRPEFRPKLNKLLISILVFFGIVTIASLLGVNVYKSFWGNIERGEGLLPIYHVLAFFFIATQVLKTRKQWLWFLNGSILVTLIASIYGMMQNLGADVLNTTGSRVASTIGNASFFAGYLLFGIFLSAFLFSKIKNKAIRLLYGATILFEIYLLIETETRGAFLGLLGGLIIVALLYLIFSKNKSKKIKQFSAGFILLIIIMSGLIWIQKDSEFVAKIPILRRLTTISLTDITTQSRLLTWDSSWRGFKDRPLLGYGWENYNVAFNKYFHAEIYRDAGSQIWFDRAHNFIFDVAVNSGFLGIIAYFSIFVMALRALYKHYKNNNDFLTAAFLTGLLTAYVVQNLFVFDVLATYISFYTLLGYITFIEFQNTEKAPQETKPSKNFTSILPGAAVILLALLALGIYNFNVKPAQANLKAVEALISQNGRQYENTGKLFKEAIDFNTYQTGEIRQKYAEYAVNLISMPNVDQALVSQEFSHAINEMKENIKRYPLDVQYYMFLMILYNRSSHFDNSRLDLLLKVADQAITMSPTRPQIYYETGQAYINKQEYEAGIRDFQKAVDLQPLAKESRWNLAAAYILAGRPEKAQAEFNWLEEHGYKYNSVSNLRKMINVYNNIKDWANLADVYENLSILEPTNPNWYAQAAVAYQQLGNTAKALEAVEKAIEIEPGLAPQADAFIKSLGIDLNTTSPEVEEE